MEFLRPSTLVEALEARSAHPDGVPIMGGTDVMVELNFDKRRPSALIDLTRVPELTEWGVDGGRTRLGAGVPYTRIIEHLSGRAPALAKASRSVASPRSATAARSAATWAGPPPPVSPTRHCWPRTPRSSSPPSAAPAG